ncbi:hypothetical protein GCM10023169_12090 [Georgenia halophila]|uniref:Uncharacterized protein n=1 Tax=Georgenia halophila TaxID=620889 RepID=A0ABP8KU86_9MICO
MSLRQLDTGFRTECEVYRVPDEEAAKQWSRLWHVRHVRDVKAVARVGPCPRRRTSGEKRGDKDEQARTQASCPQGQTTEPRQAPQRGLSVEGRSRRTVAVTE